MYLPFLKIEVYCCIIFLQVKVSETIASTIQSITSDFQIGFGSFVDKEVMPYISLVQKQNCQQKSCPKPYSFQHQMNLSSDAELFKWRVQNAPISGNIDNPEGGFDALMQVSLFMQYQRVTNKFKGFKIL